MDDNNKFEEDFLGCTPFANKYKPSVIIGNEPLKKNMFLVRFSEGCKFQEWWVQRIEKSPHNFLEPKPQYLTITFREIDKMGDGAFIDECKKFNNLKKRTIVFEDLDKTGRVLCSERYVNCFAREIHFEPCDYDDSSTKHCQVIFDYEQVF